VELATVPIVLATELAAHGSGAAVADGTEEPAGAASAAMVAPPAAHTANAANRLRRVVAWVGVIDELLQTKVT
jgi:hypothetical protein